MSKYRNEQEFLAKQMKNLPLSCKPYIKNIYPCFLEVFFVGKISCSVFDKLKNQIEVVFNSFFYDITLIRKIKLDYPPNDINTTEEFNLLDNTLSKVILFSTNVFYSMMKDRMLARNLGFGIGLTDLPIYSSSDEKLLFLFGEANLNYNSAIVSSYNLWNFTGAEVIEERIIKEMIHEIGHLILGTEHCSNEHCVMQFSKNVIEIDRKSNLFCQKCNSKLENIRSNFNF
jgi:predicted Zn-dependent protease